jgi:hypothetical protein
MYFLDGSMDSGNSYPLREGVSVIFRTTVLGIEVFVDATGGVEVPVSSGAVLIRFVVQPAIRTASRITE